MCSYDQEARVTMKNAMPRLTEPSANREELDEVADLFRVFADATRVRLIQVLFDRECCVQELTEYLGMSQSAVSHQLSILRQARLVRFRRDGKNIYYTLDDEHVARIFQFARDHVQERK